MMPATQTIKNRIAPDKVKYVRDSDVLFIHLSPFLYYYGDEVQDGMYVIRRDKDNGILGFQILDYSKRTPEQIRGLLSSEGYELASLPQC